MDKAGNPTHDLNPMYALLSKELPVLISR